MTPKNLKTSPLENHPLPTLAMKPAIARLDCVHRLHGRALTARLTTHFIA